MSENAAATADPFEATMLDEETELAALANSLRLADGFRLLFARCNQLNQRVRLMTKLMSDFPPETVIWIHFTDPIPHLLDAVRERLPASPPRAVFVSGLEYSLPVAAEAENTPFIANLNTARNSFPSAIPCPLVLWLPEYALTAVIRGAPDFFSIRSGVYFFASLPEETAPLVNAVTTGSVWRITGLPLREKQERIEAIEGLLQDYQSLAYGQRDPRAEAELLKRLGNLHDSLGQRVRAEQAYQQCLRIFRELEDRQGEGIALGNLGVVYDGQGRLAEAEQAYQQSLQICRDLRDRQGEGHTLDNLAVVYQEQERLAEAEQACQQSLQISRDLEDRQGEGVVLGNLGVVYQEQGRLAEAEQVYQQSLQISRDLGDRQGEGAALNNLGFVYQEQGRLAEAEQACQQSLQISRDLGNREREGQTLGNLALVKEAKGNIMEATGLGHAAIEILMTTENVTSLKQMQDRVEEWERLGSTSLSVARRLIK